MKKQYKKSCKEVLIKYTEQGSDAIKQVIVHHTSKSKAILAWKKSNPNARLVPMPSSGEYSVEAYTIVKCCRTCKHFQEYCNLYPDYPSRGQCLKTTNMMLWFNECKDFEAK
jgi:hypothetical protein